ncbi:MAG: hypothetical protein ACD_7C00419G0005 [uncultured bacterium]|nr:MAG: hypothetical protein ACD_7C00419G0005 [uncultured bacterium]HBR79330.1 hypothetical protein [Candidatus Moranbacteria bacterium]
MPELNKVTLVDAKKHVEAVSLAKGIKAVDPIGYFIEEISEIEKRLAQFKKGEGDIPADMTQDEAIDWLSGVLVYQKAYLACFQKNMTIGEIVIRKGMVAGEIIDRHLCDSEKVCCPGVTVKLGHAAELAKKSHLLSEILAKLNTLPDRSV